MDVNWNEYAQTKTAAYITVQRRGTKKIAKRMVVVSSAESLFGQRVENMVKKARENAERREFRQGGRKKCLHGFDYRPVSRGSKVVDCAILKEMSLAAWQVLSHKALDGKAEKLEMQEQRER